MLSRPFPIRQHSTLQIVQPTPLAQPLALTSLVEQPVLLKCQWTLGNTSLLTCNLIGLGVCSTQTPRSTALACPQARPT
jgi:hypothetical protein